MKEFYHGPVAQWEPSKVDQEFIDGLLASDKEIDNAYGKVYQAGCFVKEFVDIAAVGEMQALETARFRLGEEIDPGDFSIGDCIALGMYPGNGDTRAEAVLDSLQKVIEARNEDPNEPTLYGSFIENGYKVEAFMPSNSNQARQWTIRVYKLGEEAIFRELTVPMISEPVFGVDNSDREALEARVDSLMHELNK